MVDWKNYAPIIIRYSLVAVFLSFGAMQLTNVESWTAYLPEFAWKLPISANALIIMNALFEIVAGIMLAIGIFVRPIAILLGLHLAAITISLGFNEVAVRDFGLTMATFTIAANGADDWCLEKKWNKKDTLLKY